MADLSSSASRRQLSVTTPPQISKGGQGSENLIPLSPQCLLPKPGESKTGMLPGEKPPSPNPSFGSRLDTTKSSGNGDEIRDTQKKDVFRPSLMDMEAGGRRERWRDEERDTNSSGRKDRWRDGDKEIGDTRKMDRWMENSSAKHFGEARRAPPERWTDSSNKESNYEQQRESKWNMRWGPDDKEAEGLHDKWADSGRDGLHLDKSLSHVGNHVKDEKDGDHHRPWRSNSSQARGRQLKTSLLTFRRFCHRYSCLLPEMFYFKVSRINKILTSCISTTTSPVKLPGSSFGCNFLI